MITVCTAVYGRPRVFEVFCKNYSTLSPRPHVVVCGAFNDPCHVIALRYGFTYLPTEVNRPLGQKFNYLFATTWEKFPSDYYMVMGSDDLMDQVMWDYYQQFTGHYLGLRDYWFVNMEDLKCMYWRGYPEGSKREYEPIGAARMIMHDVLTELRGEPFSDHNDRIDYDWHNKVMNTGALFKPVLCAETGGISIDMKTAENQNTWKLFSNSELRTFDELQERSPYIANLLKEF